MTSSHLQTWVWKKDTSEKETHTSRDLPVTLWTETNTTLISKNRASRRRRSLHKGIALLHLFHFFSKMRARSVHCVHTENICNASLLPGVQEHSYKGCVAFVMLSCSTAARTQRKHTIWCSIFPFLPHGIWRIQSPVFFYNLCTGPKWQEVHMQLQNSCKQKSGTFSCTMIIKTVCSEWKLKWLANFHRTLKHKI